MLDDSYEKTHTSRTVVRRDIFSGDHFFNINFPLHCAYEGALPSFFLLFVRSRSHFIVRYPETF